MTSFALGSQEQQVIATEHTAQQYRVDPQTAECDVQYFIRTKGMNTTVSHMIPKLST